MRIIVLLIILYLEWGGRRLEFLNPGWLAALPHAQSEIVD
jgi:hypothetical protein